MTRRKFIGPFGVEFYADNLHVVKPSKVKIKIDRFRRPASVPKPPKPVKPKSKPGRKARPKPEPAIETIKPPRKNAHIEIDGWIDIRSAIVERDNYQCAECRSPDQLTVHHIDRDRRNNDRSNLVTLCWSCHRKKHHKIGV